MIELRTKLEVQYLTDSNITYESSLLPSYYLHT